MPIADHAEASSKVPLITTLTRLVDESEAW
jgi:hypothetical protein